MFVRAYSIKETPPPHRLAKFSIFRSQICFVMIILFPEWGHTESDKEHVYLSGHRIDFPSQME